MTSEVSTDHHFLRITAVAASIGLHSVAVKRCSGSLAHAVRFACLKHLCKLVFDFCCQVPGLLVIDTPGHESFTNLRSRGSSLCDIAILVVDLMHGLEPQTIESLNLLRNRKTPFIVALNKVDRLLEWKVTANAPIRDSLNRQKKHTTADFEDRLKFCTTQLMEQGLNVALYWKNKDPRKFVSMVPTSAITGEGIPDLLQLLVKLTTAMMSERLMFLSELQCTVLEVKAIEGLGTTIDVVLVNGVLKEGVSFGDSKGESFSKFAGYHSKTVCVEQFVVFIAY